MPIYEYECQACGRQMEAQQRITESPLVDCPACNQPRLQRLISATSFTLKGGGWYKDGYGSSSDKKPRTENDRIDRLTKAVDDDKKKTAAESGSTDSGGGDAAPSAPATTTPSSGGGGGGSSTT